MTFDDWLNAYYKKFGKNYPLVIVDEKSDREIIADILACIENNAPAKEPSCEEDLIY